MLKKKRIITTKSRVLKVMNVSVFEKDFSIIKMMSDSAFCKGHKIRAGTPVSTFFIYLD
jgi:hypothetical protein